MRAVIGLELEFTKLSKENNQQLNDAHCFRKYDLITVPLYFAQGLNHHLGLVINNNNNEIDAVKYVDYLPIYWGYFAHARLLTWACYNCNFLLFFLSESNKPFVNKWVANAWGIIDEMMLKGADINQLNAYEWYSSLDCFSLEWAESAHKKFINSGARSGKAILEQVKVNPYPYYLPPEDIYTESAKIREQNFQQQLYNQRASHTGNLLGHFRQFQKFPTISLRPDLPAQICLLDQRGYTLMMSAAYHGNLGLLSDLSDWGSPVNFCDYRGYTALFYSLVPLIYINENLIHRFSHQIPVGAQAYCTNEWSLVNPAVVKLLLDAGADPNWLAEAGVTPLVLAVELGKWDIVDLLLRYGADINRRDQWGRTVLHTITGVLFERPSRFRQTFGELVFQYGSQRVFEYIALPDEPNDPELDEAEEVLKASNLYHIDDLKQLLARGADPHLPDNEGITPYELAQKHRPDWAVVMHPHGEAL